MISERKNVTGLGQYLPVTVPVSIVIVYFAWFVATPFTRFHFLDAIHFERLLMALGWIGLIFTGAIRFPKDKTTIAYLFLFASMLLSYFLTPFPEYATIQLWGDDYWKLVVLYFLITLSIKDERDFGAVAVGCLAVIAGYQAYSLLDYMGGGSYVFQQGIRRVIGVWTAPELGAPNFFGLIGVMSLAFAEYMQTTRTHFGWKILVFGCWVIVWTAIILSGTRGALAVGVIIALWTQWRRLLKFRRFVFGIVVILVGVSFVPDKLVERYASILQFSVLGNKAHKGDADQPAMSISEESAQGRVEGLQDGLKLWARNPIVGWGPGSSARARFEVGWKKDYELELHNLYGQVPAELGTIGVVIFLTLVFRMGSISWRLIHEAQTMANPTICMAAGRLIGALLLFNLLYGFSSHTLYRFYWIYLFGLASAADHLFPSVKMVRRRTATVEAGRRFSKHFPTAKSAWKSGS